MAGSVTIRIGWPGDKTQAILKSQLQPSSDRSAAAWVALRQLFNSIAAGCERASLDVAVGAADFAAASGTVAPAQASITAGDVVYVGSVGFVATNGAVTLGAATFDMRTSTAAVCTSLAAQINAHASLTGVVTASASTTTVTITAVNKGGLGSHITLAKANTTAAAFVLNGLANTVLQSTLLSGTGGLDSAPVTYVAR